MIFGIPFAVIFCIGAPLVYPILISAVLISTIFMVVSDILGIFFPEIGRFARHEPQQRLNFIAQRYYAIHFKKEKTVAALKFFGLDAKATTGDLKTKCKALKLQHPDKAPDQDETTTLDFKLFTKYRAHLKLVLSKGEAGVKSSETTPAPLSISELN
ncbi:MAG: hypothetical protein KR126chlam2_00918 [Chlamydiae bacterium]|nr:hypothetical protein [Chlamydiota bacterium]